MEPAIQGNGGLTNAVRSSVNAGTLEDVLWVGTLGFPTDTLDERQKEQIHEKLEGEFDSLTVFVSDSDLDGHYAHYCKTILWPVFHYQIPDHPKSKAYEDHSWVFYVHLNQAFADKIVENYKRGDIIWVHDYHLLLVPKMVREKLPDAQIGFFLHSAFPSSEVFRCLSVRNELLEGMLGANLVAFQTQEYAHHFLQTCSRLLVVEATEEGVQLERRFVNVLSVPIGIDPKGLSELRQEPEVREWINLMEERYKGKHLIVARDKLDHVRGVRQKLLAFELFLNKYPEWRDKVVLIQVATSTTEHQDLAETVSDIVTRIDSQHSTLAHQPLVFLRQDIAFSQYLALLSIADVLMITSLREGMNLTCHEYVYCQDGALCDKKYGPLILSEFTGSASVFRGSELSVNPWHYQQCAEAIKKALEMKDEEKETRYKKLRDVVVNHTGEFWCTSLVKALAKYHEEHFKRDTLSIPRLSITQLANQYKATHKRLFFLDYEGTLTPFGSPTRVVLSSQERIIEIVSTLTNDPANIVYIMSDLKPSELELTFTRVSGLGFIAENGCFVRDFGDGGDWTPFADLDGIESWKNSVKGILQYYVDRVEGSYIEERLCALVFHYEKADDEEAATRQAGDCANHINDACANQRIRAVPVKGGLIIEPIDWDKSTAAKHVWNNLLHSTGSSSSDEPPDFLFVAGNDRDDEVIFKWAAELQKNQECANVMTVNVGSRSTSAMTTITQGTTGEFLHSTSLARKLTLVFFFFRSPQRPPAPHQPTRRARFEKKPARKFVLGVQRRMRRQASMGNIAGVESSFKSRISGLQ